LIEDTAWGIGGSFQKKYLGTIGDIGTFSFDFAKTLTTGEGGMLLFKNKNICKRAQAWHDHGHENKPRLKRWEDTRRSSGFNFRMTELQAAVGLAQLKKFDKIFLKHKKNKDKVLSVIKNIKHIKYRTIPKDSIDASESIIFSFSEESKAKLFRKKLLEYKYSTKILPEATTWHFAGHWKHIKSLDRNSVFDYPKSYELLKRSVSIPVSFSMKRSFPKILKNVILNIL